MTACSAALSFVSTPQKPLRKSWRKKVWEAEIFFRCPLVGMCLTLAEQRKIFQQFNGKEKKRTDFFMHEVLVANLGSENPISKKIDSLLGKKYGAASKKYGQLEEHEFLELWYNKSEQNFDPQLLWIAAVHEHLSHGTRLEIFGSVHMAVHEQAKLAEPLRQKFEELNHKFNQLKSILKEARRDAELQSKERQHLEHELQASTQQIELLRQQTDALPKRQPLEKKTQVAESRNSQEVLRLRTELATRTDELRSAHKRLKDLKKEHENFMKEFSEQAHRLMVLEEGGTCTTETCSPDCPSFDLCKKRVLIVGGLNRLEGFFRQFVEERGGILEFHNGHLRGGVKALENSFRRADVILCPVNCNSHGACLLVKSLGKKHNKTVHMLPSYGLSTITRVMGEACAN